MTDEQITAALKKEFEMEEDEVKALVLHQGGLDMRAPRKSD